MKNMNMDLPAIVEESFNYTITIQDELALASAWEDWFRSEMRCFGNYQFLVDGKVFDRKSDSDFEVSVGSKIILNLKPSLRLNR